jgi:hypothetical protein
MTAERSQKQPFPAILPSVPIFKKLQFTVFVFVCTFFAVLGVVFFVLGLYFGRAGVVGRKAEKQATHPSADLCSFA